MIMNSTIVKYAEKWKIPPEGVLIIYEILNTRGYERGRKVLNALKIEISYRELRYFHKKVILDERVDLDKKGKPQNYRNLLRKI